MGKSLQIYELEDQKTNVIDNLITKEKILMIDARPFSIQDELIKKDESLYRGAQLQFEHLTQLISSSTKYFN